MTKLILFEGLLNSPNKQFNILIYLKFSEKPMQRIKQEDTDVSF